MRADFARFYNADLDAALSQWSIGKVYDLIKHLPPGAAYWRAQGRKDLVEVVHEWALTFIRFQGGDKVTTPTLYEQESTNDGETIRTNDPAEIRKFLSDAFRQS